MADFTIVSQTLIDGPRNSVFKVTGNITGGAQAYAVLISPATLTDMNPGMSGAHLATLLRIDHIDYSISDNATVQLFWDATTPLPICELYGRGKLEAKMWGGYQNNAGVGVTGSIGMAIIATAAGAPTDTSVLLVIHTVKYRPITVGGA